MEEADPVDRNGTGGAQPQLADTVLGEQPLVLGRDELLAEHGGLDRREPRGDQAPIDLHGRHRVQRCDVFARKQRDDRAARGEQLAGAHKVVADADRVVPALGDAQTALHAPLVDDLAAALDHADRVRGAVTDARPAVDAGVLVDGEQRPVGRDNAREPQLTFGLRHLVASPHERLASASASPSLRRAASRPQPSVYMTTASPTPTATTPTRYIASQEPSTSNPSRGTW